MSKEYKRGVCSGQIALLTPDEQEKIRNRQGDVCFYCDKPFDNERGDPVFDHLIPRSSGGRHDQLNRVAACSACDGAKSNRMPTEKELNKFLYQLSEI